jgi:hypothetical protein
MKMTERTVQLPEMQLRAEFQPKSIDAEKRSVDMIWTVGSKVLRSDFWTGERYFEELSLDPAHVRMDRLNSGRAPFLANHSSRELGDVLGVVESATVGGESVAKVRFSERSEIDGIWKDVQSGVLRNVSVGYKIHKFEKLPLAEGEKIPTYRAIDWEPFEISLVPIGADADAHIRSEGHEGKRNDCVIVNEEIALERGEEEKEEMQKETTPPVASVDVAQVSQEAVKAERARVAEINELCRKVQLESSVAEKLVADGVAIEEARKAIIDAVAAKAGAEIRRPVIQAGGQDESQTRAAAVQNALEHRMLGSALSETGRDYRGSSIVEMARSLVNGRGLTPSEVISRAMTSADFPLILGNVAEKKLMQAYKVLPKTFEPLVSNGTLRDYKAAKRYQIGDAPSLAAIAEGAAYAEGTTPTEKAETIQLADYGKKLIFSRQMMINDDLGAFDRVINAFGASAARLESSLVYGVLTSNPTMGDTKALFHLDHGNLGTAAAISESSLSAMEQLIMAQTTLDGSDYLGLVAKFLVCGTANKVAAQKLLSSIMATASGDVNPFANAYQLIVDPRVTGTKWFMVCSPAEIGTIEVARLEGENGPVVDSKEDFDTDGIAIKCRHTVAVKALEWKGMAYNAGA